MQRNFHWLACLKRRGKTCDVFCFDGDNFRVRSQSFDGQGNAGEQTRATHRNDHRVQIGNLLDDFESHRPLAGNDRRIVIPIDVRESFFFRDLVCARPGFSEIFSVKNDGRAKFLTITYFNQRREPRHHHCSRNAEQFALVDKRLSVIARSTAMQYKHTQKSLDQIARECRPDYILEGSVRRENNRLRITGQLFKSGDQGSLWTQAYDLDAKDLLIIQRDVADRIARSLSLEVLPQRASAASGANPLNADAYDEYLKGLFELNQRTESALRRSITSFETATAKDPNFAAAYASLAAAYNVGAGWNFFSPADSYPKAKAAAQKALSLDESLPDAHAAYAEVLHDYDWDWGDAEREYQRTLELNPSSASGHKGYAEYLTHAGRYDAALAEIRRAQALDPGSLVMSALVCYVYYHAREYEKAVHECGKRAVLRVVIASQPERNVHAARISERNPVARELIFRLAPAEAQASQIPLESEPRQQA